LYALYPPIDLALFFLGFSVLTSRALFGPERALFGPERALYPPIDLALMVVLVLFL